LPVDRPPGQSLGQDIDERLLQIDVARSSLETALAAIDELKQLADKNKADLDEALARLHEANENKMTAEQQAEVARQVARVDVSALRKVVGIPTRTQVAWGVARYSSSITGRAALPSRMTADLAMSR